MRKMLIGLTLLAVLFVSVTVNSFYLNKTLKNIQREIIESLPLPPEEAEAVINKSFVSWEDAGSYLKLIINDSRLESISEAYFDCVDKPDNIVIRNKLIYLLEDLINSERLSFQALL